MRKTAAIVALAIGFVLACSSWSGFTDASKRMNELFGEFNEHKRLEVAIANDQVEISNANLDEQIARLSGKRVKSFPREKAESILDADKMILGDSSSLSDSLAMDALEAHKKFLVFLAIAAAIFVVAGLALYPRTPPLCMEAEDFPVS
jgi:hypothetical protein